MLMTAYNCECSFSLSSHGGDYRGRPSTEISQWKPVFKPLHCQCMVSSVFLPDVQRKTLERNRRSYVYSGTVGSYVVSRLSTGNVGFHVRQSLVRILQVCFTNCWLRINNWIVNAIEMSRHRNGSKRVALSSQGELCWKSKRERLRSNVCGLHCTCRCFEPTTNCDIDPIHLLSSSLSFVFSVAYLLHLLWVNTERKEWDLYVMHTYEKMGCFLTPLTVYRSTAQNRPENLFRFAVNRLILRHLIWVLFWYGANDSRTIWRALWEDDFTVSNIPVGRMPRAARSNKFLEIAKERLGMPSITSP